MQTLKREKLALDRKKRQQTRADVLLTFRSVLDQELPRGYTPRLYEQKCDQLYQHIYDAYADAEHNLYATAS